MKKVSLLLVVMALVVALSATVAMAATGFAQKPR
jgi:hypothetical protein